MNIAATSIYKLYLLKATCDKKASDNPKAIMLLENDPSKVFELWAKHLLQNYHKKFNATCKSLNVEYCTINYPLLCTVKRDQSALFL